MQYSLPVVLSPSPFRTGISEGKLCIKTKSPPHSKFLPRIKISEKRSPRKTLLHTHLKYPPPPETLYGGDYILLNRRLKSALLRCSFRYLRPKWSLNTLICLYIKCLIEEILVKLAMLPTRHEARPRRLHIVVTSLVPRTFNCACVLIVLASYCHDVIAVRRSKLGDANTELASGLYRSIATHIEPWRNFVFSPLGGLSIICCYLQRAHLEGVPRRKLRIKLNIILF